MSNPVILTALGCIAATYLFFWALLHFTQDSKEPPIVSSSIPFISPILGMIRWSMDFYPHMRKKHRELPIYTLRLPGTRIYVINSVELIPIVQRQWRTLIFAPIQVKAVKIAMGGSPETLALLEKDLITDHGFVNGVAKATHPTLSNGPGLDGLNGITFRVFNEELNQLRATPTTVNLYEWVGKKVMRATTDAVYGPANPMADPQNLEAWHKYHPSLMFMMLDLLPPNLFFRTAIHNREKLVQSFTTYYTSGAYKHGSPYIQELVNYCHLQNLLSSEIPRFILGTLFINVANSIPTAFWVIYRIFSDPLVLEECRNEVLQSVQEDEDGASMTINVNYILNSCPILLSTYQEVFRYHGMANSVRIVSEDHWLENKYLLKKGNIIIMSAKAQHRNPENWGENVDEFYHRRFMKQQVGSTGKKINPVAFRGFGGGTTLCPGRHFATSEILLLVSSLILRFDIKPTNGRPWVMPTTARSSQAEAMEQPDTDFEIEFLPRREAINKTWGVAFSGCSDAKLMAQS